jgi:hypothetical protein
MFSNHDITTVDTAYSQFFLKVSPSTTKEDLLNPQNYRKIIQAHNDVGRKFFNFGDIVRVLAEDGSFYAELLIIGSNNSELFTRINHFVSHKKDKKSTESKDFDIKWDEKSKFNLIRKSDNKLIKSGFTCEEEALYYIKNIY